MKIEEMRELIVAEAYRNACEELVRQAHQEERERICDLLWDLLDLSELSPQKAIPVKLKNVLESIKRGELPEVNK